MLDFKSEDVASRARLPRGDVRQVMPLVERVADRSVTLVSAQTKKRLGAGARDLLAAIEGTAQGCDGKAKVFANSRYVLVFCALLFRLLASSCSLLPEAQSVELHGARCGRSKSGQKKTDWQKKRASPATYLMVRIARYRVLF